MLARIGDYKGTSGVRARRGDPTETCRWETARRRDGEMDGSDDKLGDSIIEAHPSAINTSAALFPRDTASTDAISDGSGLLASPLPGLRQPEPTPRTTSITSL